MALILWISLTFVFFWYSDDIEFLFKNAIATVFFGVDVEKEHLNNCIFLSELLIVSMDLIIFQLIFIQF